MKIAKRGHRLFLRAGLLAGAVIIGAFLLLSITRHQGGTGKEDRISVHFSRASEFIRISSASNESVSFEKDIYLIFERSCFFCHGPIGTLQDFVLISAVLSSAMTETGR